MTHRHTHYDTYTISHTHTHMTHYHTHTHTHYDTYTISHTHTHTMTHTQYHTHTSNGAQSRIVTRRLLFQSQMYLAPHGMPTCIYLYRSTKCDKHITIFIKCIQIAGFCFFIFRLLLKKKKKKKKKKRKRKRRKSM